MDENELSLFNEQYAAFNEQHRQLAHADGGYVEPQLMFFADGTPVALPQATKLRLPNPQNQNYKGKGEVKTTVIKIRNSHKDDRNCLLFGRKGKKGLISESDTGFAAMNDVKDVNNVQETSLQVVHFDEIVASFLEDIQAGKNAFEIVRMKVQVQSKTGVYDVSALLFLSTVEQKGQEIVETRVHGLTYSSDAAYNLNRLTMDLNSLGQAIKATANRSLQITVPGDSLLSLSFTTANNMDLAKSYENAAR